MYGIGTLHKAFKISMRWRETNFIQIRKTVPNSLQKPAQSSVLEDNYNLTTQDLWTKLSKLTP